jgi:23S rRNA (guanosine2251-2'-O)-methyltransferase
VSKEKIYIYGKHALLEALAHAPEAIKKVYLAPAAKEKNLTDLIERARIPHAPLEGGKGKEAAGERASHQGIIALVEMEQLIRPYDAFVETVSPTPDTALLLLDEVQDPHNVGALIRSAAAFGISGVLMPEHKQAPVTGAVVKVSAGMAFRIPLVRIGNVNETIRDLKKRGFWIYGLEGDSKSSITREKFDAPAVFVLGNEGVGIRQKTKELCDVLLAIPMHPRAESLNVAASGAVALHVWSASHPDALKKK